MSSLIFRFVLTKRCLLGLFCSIILNTQAFAASPPIIGPIIFPSIEVNESVSQTITLDPRLSLNRLRFGLKDKLRPNRGLTHYIPTSIYVEAGDGIRMSALTDGSARLCINKISERALCEQKIKFSESEKVFVAHVAGEVYIENLMPDHSSMSSVTITGGTEMPVFIAGQHSDNEFLEMLDNSKTPNIHLVGEKITITGPVSKLIRYNVTEPNDLLNGWDKLIEWGELDYGFSNDLAPLHQPMPHKVLFLDVGSDGWGGFYATSYHLGTGTDYGFSRVVKSSELFEKGGWGPWHEYGHTLQPKFIQFNGMTEVTVNITSLNTERRLGLNSRITDRWDTKIFPYLDKHSDEKDFFTSELGLFDKLGLFWQLDLTFGPRFYQRMATNMRNQYADNSQLDYEGADERVQRFIQQASLTTGYDLREYFLKWGINANSSTNAFLDNLKGHLKHEPLFTENSDNFQPITDHHFGSDVSISYKPLLKESHIYFDYFRTWQPGSRAVITINGEFVGEVEENHSEQFEIEVDPKTATNFVRITRALEFGDRIKVRFESLNVSDETFVFKNKKYLRGTALAEKDKIKLTLGKGLFRNNKFDLKAFIDEQLIFSCSLGQCDGAQVTFNKKKAKIVASTALTEYQRIKYFIKRENGESENVIYAR